MATLTLFSAFQDAHHFTFNAEQNAWVSETDGRVLLTGCGSTLPDIPSAPQQVNAEAGYLICAVTLPKRDTPVFLRVTLAHNILCSGAAGSAVGAIVVADDKYDFIHRSGLPAAVVDDIIEQITYGLNEGSGVTASTVSVYAEDSDGDEREITYPWCIASTRQAEAPHD